MLTYVPNIGTPLSDEKYFEFGYSNDSFYSSIIIPLVVLIALLAINLIAFLVTIPFKNKNEIFKQNLKGRIIYWFVEEYSLFFLLIAFYNCTHLNWTGAGYASFALSILFLAVYALTVVFLLIAFACWKEKHWPKSLSNACASIERNRISMFIKIVLFYGKWLMFAFLISMDKDI